VKVPTAEVIVQHSTYCVSLEPVRTYQILRSGRNYDFHDSTMVPRVRFTGNRHVLTNLMAVSTDEFTKIVSKSLREVIHCDEFVTYQFHFTTIMEVLDYPQGYYLFSHCNYYLQRWQT